MDEDFEFDHNKIYRLELLHSKLTQLLEAFGEFLRIEDSYKWHQVLSHFNILKAHYEGLFSELRQISVEKQLVLPLGMPEVPQMVPEVLLRTRPIPEIESENEKLLALGSSVIEGDERSASVIENPGCSEDKEARILDIWEINMRAYDSIVESVCDIMRDDGDIRRTLKTRLEDLEPKSSIDSKKQKLEEDREWLRKSLMWISSGPMSWVHEEKMIIEREAV